MKINWDFGTPHPVTFVRQPAGDPVPDGDSPTIRGRLIIHYWQDPGPRDRWDQKPGGHTRKVDSFSGHAGHHHGGGELRWHQRQEAEDEDGDLEEFDWDIVIEVEIDIDIRDGVTRRNQPVAIPIADDAIIGVHNSSAADSVWVPNARGTQYFVIFITIRNGRKYIYLKRGSVNW